MKMLHVLVIIVVFFAGLESVQAAPIVPDSFSTTWDGGDSSVIQINLGACPDSVYWEEIDNESNNGTSTVCSEDDNDFGDQLITFPYAGRYRVDFSGSFEVIDLKDQNNRDKFRTVEQWGNSMWVDLSGAFNQVTDLTFNAVDVPDLSNVTDLSNFLNGASNFNSLINDWNVSNVTDMSQMFRAASSFDQPLDSWDVSSVTNMEGMFQDAISFNQPLNTWDVSNVSFFQYMFDGASNFDQSLSNWDFNNMSLLSEGAPLSDFLNGTNISPVNYSAVLTVWSQLDSILSNVYVGSSAQYCSSAQAARDILTGDYDWIITDGGATLCSEQEEEGNDDDDDNSGGSTATRIGDRLKNQLETTTTSTPIVVTKETFFEGVKKLITYLKMNEDELAQLSAAESKEVIIGLRNIVMYLLSLLT